MRKADKFSTLGLLNLSGLHLLMLVFLATAHLAAEVHQSSGSIHIATERIPDKEVEKKHGTKMGLKMGHDKLVALEFLDAEGKTRRSVSLEEKKFVDGTEERVSVRKTKNGRFAIVQKSKINSKERNPYVLRNKKVTAVTWYDSVGNVLCETKISARSGVRLVSGDGSRAVIVHGGFDPVEFEKYNDVKNLKSLDVLHKDPQLTKSHIEVIGHDCKVLLSRQGRADDFQHIGLSPKANWIFYDLGKRKKDASGKVIRISKAIEIKSGKEYKIQHSEVPHEILDDGTMFHWKYLGESKPPKNVFRKWVWTPKSKKFKETKEEKERWWE